MKPIYYIVALMGLLAACTKPGSFADYRQEVFPETPINMGVEKTIQLVNPNTDDVQKIGAIDFDAGGNQEGHFEIVQVSVAGKVVPRKNIIIPKGGSAEVRIGYKPQKMQTTHAAYAGWVTGEPRREMPLSPGESAPTEEKMAIHRGLVVASYHYPEPGLVQIELIGTAVPGPGGERVASANGPTGACEPKGNVACFTGNFAIDIPGLMKGGAIEFPMVGAIPIQIEGGTARMVMDHFPNVLMVIKGNGPGEPLEGKPLAAASIIISGAKGITGIGTFDGSALTLQGVGLRVRVVLGEVLQEDIGPGMATAVDFEIKEVPLTTSVPYTSGEITLKMDKTLSGAPSGNDLFDQFLGGAHVITELSGKLALPQ